MSKTALIKELSNEIAEIVKYRENNKGNLRFWWGTADRKYSRARFRRLRLTIEEILKDLEKTM